MIELAKLNKACIVAWHQTIAETPARLRTKPGAAQKHRAADDSSEAVRRRRATANRVLTILKAVLNHAHREGKCASDDAWRTVRAFREADAARLRYLTDDKARRLTNACPADFRALVTGALLTGCRYGELAAMTLDDFNSDAGTLRVRQAKSGKGSDSAESLPEILFAHLKRILKLDRLRLRGPNGARDEFHLAATAQNLRKLAKLIPIAPPIAAT